MSATSSSAILHIHSTYSHDGRDTLEALAEQALQRGVSTIFLGDHAEDLSAELFVEYVEHCGRASTDRVQIVPGLEFRFSGYPGLHLVAIGLREWIVPETPEAFMTMAPLVADLTMLAHPILARYQVPDAVRKGIGAVEVWNARYNTRYLPDPRAMALFHSLRKQRPDVVAVAGLDQHDGGNDRGVRVHTFNGAAHALQDIRGGNFTNVGRFVEFDSAATYSGIGFAALRACRILLDVVSRAQDRLARLRHDASA